MRLAMRVVGVPIFGTIAALLSLWAAVLIRREFAGSTDTATGVVAGIGGGILFLAWLFGAAAVALLLDAGARVWRVVLVAALGACAVTIFLADAMGAPALVGLAPLGAVVVVAFVQVRDPRDEDTV